MNIPEQIEQISISRAAKVKKCQWHFDSVSGE